MYTPVSLPSLLCCGLLFVEGNLHNPALFSGMQPPVWQMAKEYLDLVKTYPCPLSYVRGHIFKILHHSLLVHLKQRDMLAVAKNLDDIIAVVDAVEELSKVIFTEYSVAMSRLARDFI